MLRFYLFFGITFRQLTNSKDVLMRPCSPWIKEWEQQQHNTT